MSREVYLADTSVFARLSKAPVAAAFGPLAAAGAVALCAPVVFELGFSAQSHGDYKELTERLLAFTSVPTSEADQRRALDLQAALAARGQLRAISLVDALVAAVAEARGLTILHYDADFELIARITGQAQEWIVERGTAD
ncbi:MAG: PIN domain-containing protein [Chloroflexota bacterium]